MTPWEARRVAEIAVTADGGCSNCAGDLLTRLHKVFPEHDDAWAAAFLAEWDYNIPEWMPDPPDPAVERGSTDR